MSLTNGSDGMFRSRVLSSCAMPSENCDLNPNTVYESFIADASLPVMEIPRHQNSFAKSNGFFLPGISRFFLPGIVHFPFYFPEGKIATKSLGGKSS